MWWKKDKQAKVNFLALDLAKKLAPVLEKRLNEMSQPFERCPDEYDSKQYGSTPESPYTVRVESGSNKKRCFVRFDINRGHIPGHSSYFISFVLVVSLSDPSDIEHKLQYLDVAAYKEKLDPREYQEIRNILSDFFGGNWEEQKYDSCGDNEYIDKNTRELVTVY
ncbi:MAG: hypothetical protein PHE59_03215 [Patescibacteria group bacterium]|nr:hypothetical protein [Patescibacteria group bacterium]MDD5164839.1 hypothetical protein [Patescibacteria group bacterium]MDD5534671.1 hypothetical protein [Patescibacteria group bacterium]